MSVFDLDKQAREHNESRQKAILDESRKNASSQPDKWGKEPVGAEISPGVYESDGFIVVGDKL